MGNRTRVKVVKNKVRPAVPQAEFDIMYCKGISREGSLLDMGVDLGIVKKSGAWFTYEGEQLGQGRENAKNFLTENPEIMVEISERIWQHGAARPVEERRLRPTPSRSTTSRSRSTTEPSPRARRRRSSAVPAASVRSPAAARRARRRPTSASLGLPTGTVGPPRRPLGPL